MVMTGRVYMMAAVEGPEGSDEAGPAAEVTDDAWNKQTLVIT